LKVLVNRVTISFSNKGGCTCIALFFHLWAYSLTIFLLLFFITIRLVRSGAMSTLNLYCFKKTSTRSLHFLTLVLSKIIYKFNTEPVKLSHKKWMSNLSLCMTFAILLQYNLMCVLGHSNPVYLINSGTLKFLGTTYLALGIS